MSAPAALTIVCDAAAGSATLLTLDPQGKATACCGHVDLGTGIEVALAQIVAEELDLPLGDVRVVLGDTALTPDQGPTIASETIQITARPLRLAAAQARMELLRLGGQRLNTDPASLRTQDGVVHGPDGAVPYADLLAGRGIRLYLDPDTPLKDPAAYRIVGRPHGRRDLTDKLTGDYRYIQDIALPGMVHGHVIRPPYAGRDSGDFIGHSLIHFDPDSVAHLPGLIDIVRVGDFLGVVAEHDHQARAIAQALHVDWRLPPPQPDLSDLRGTIRQQPATPRRLAEEGDFDTAYARSGRRLDRHYVWPYHLHGSIGPSCAVADWQGGRPIVWSGSQNPHMLRADLAVLVGLPPEQIEIRRYQAAGCYGRNCADDVCGDALLLARAVGRPVRVQLTRAQEHQWEPRGAAQVMDMRGALDRGGMVSAYSFDTWYPSNRGPNLALLLTGRITPEPRPSDMGDRTIIPPYRIANTRITVHDMAPIVRAAWMRGVSALPNTFAHECFFDEMAHEAGADPVAFRLRHIDNPRLADLIRRTADAAGWAERNGPRLRRDGRMAYGQGFAVATYVHGTFPGVAAASAAWVVDVSVDLDTGEVALHRVFVGQDQGLVINPDGVRQQIHGNVIQTASRVLAEEVTFDEITLGPKSWAAYPIQTFPAVPEIDTLLIERPGDPPLGVGESAAVPSAAAIASAIFDATGVRMREVPFTPERMRAALGGTGPTAPPPRQRRKRLGTLAGAFGGALMFGAVGLPLARAIPPSPAPSASLYSAETIEQGRQIFALGGCQSCHTAEGGAPNAGGRPIQTPFGTVHSTNLTPDPDTGLGTWSFQAFDRAMRHGISRDGHNLYPAFPYTSFARIAPGDMQALYAYLQTLAPVRSQAPPARMLGPVSLRPLMAGWNLAFHDARPQPHDPLQSDAWNRGRYLVESAGHCSACHTPRNPLGAERKAAALGGAMVDGWFAPALAGQQAAQRGWTATALFDYLRTGRSAVTVTAGPMAEVVANLRALPDADLRAMAVYLASLAPPAPAPAPPASTAPTASRAARLFDSACAACHAPTFANSLHAAQSSLDRSAVLRAPTPEALMTLLDHGLTAPDGLDLRDMPSFRGEFSAQDRADLAHWLRARHAPDLPPWP